MAEVDAGMTKVGAGMAGIGAEVTGMSSAMVAGVTYSNAKGLIYTYFKLFKFPLNIK